MRRTIVLLTTFLVILASGAWIGVAVAQKNGPAKAANDKPDLEGWKYPGESTRERRRVRRILRSAGHDRRAGQGRGVLWKEGR